MRLSLISLILCAGGVGFGVGWWVHPGAGIAVAFILLGLIALFHDDGKGQP